MDFAVQTALLGEITSAIRLVTIEVHGQAVTVRVYHNGDVTDEFRDDFEAVGTEVHALLPRTASVEVLFERNEEPNPIQILGWPVYARKGTGAFAPDDAEAYRRE